MPSRKTFLPFLFAALLLACVLSFTACVHSGGVAVYVRTPPPPPIGEPVLVAPGPGYYWIPGYQSWNGARYVWIPGHWESVPMGRRVWIQGHWAHNHHGWYWVPGHWR